MLISDWSSDVCSSDLFRFVCSNGRVCGDTVADVRVPHKGDVATHVIEGAYEVLHGFDRAQESRDAMRAITLDAGESEVFARAALALKYDEDKPARSEEHTSELQSLMRNSYAVFFLKKKTTQTQNTKH